MLSPSESESDHDWSDDVDEEGDGDEDEEEEEEGDEDGELSPRNCHIFIFLGTLHIDLKAELTSICFTLFC